MEEIREASVYGVRPKRNFRQAATKYLLENQHKASILSDAGRLKLLDKYIGDLQLDLIHMGSLQLYIEARKKNGISTRTINHGLKIVRRILNLAASEWHDEHGLTWVVTAPKIKLIPETDLRKPNPIGFDDQERFFNELPLHLRRMALFAVNTGCRDSEICFLKWDWEVKVPGMRNTVVFIIPSEKVKNREERLVVLNTIARKAIEEVRGLHPIYVFTFRGKPISRMLNTGWKMARNKTRIDLRVHDLKHTFGRRLRAAGVSFEDRQDLLGHKSGRITTHYSAVELTSLIDAAESICLKGKASQTLTVLRSLGNSNPRKSPASVFETTNKVRLGA